jgi:hypothetical protein
MTAASAAAAHRHGQRTVHQLGGFVAPGQRVRRDGGDIMLARSGSGY